MPRGMSDEVSNVIVQALNKGLSRSQIAGVVGVSPRAITRIHTNLKKHGTPKAPPKGIKLGRPTKLTKAQAEAMVPWMAERDHIFYVKDLVRYLSDGYGYSGCGGTVRRCLVRAGYNRKLPWHKSEITTWVPPDHIPAFATVEDPLPPAHTHEDGMNNDSGLEEPVEQDYQDQIRDDIDPALQDAPPLSIPSSGAHRQTHHQELSANPYNPFTTQHPQPQRVGTHLPLSPLPSPRNRNNHPALSETTQNNPNDDSQSPQLNDSNADHSQISTLQSQIAQQNLLILSLQQQLAEQPR